MLFSLRNQSERRSRLLMTMGDTYSAGHESLLELYDLKTSYFSILKNSLADRSEQSIVNQLDKRAIVPFSAMPLTRAILVAVWGTSTTSNLHTLTACTANGKSAYCHASALQDTFHSEIFGLPTMPLPHTFASLWISNSAPTPFS